MSSDNWLESFRNKEESIQKNSKTDEKNWAALKEKYKQDGETLNGIVNAELKKVCAVFGNPEL